MKKRIIPLFLLFSLFTAAVVWAAEIAKMPFLGLVEKDKVKVRSGPNENFEVLSLLDKDSKVIVLGHSYGWYRIELPDSSPAYINKIFAERTEEDRGKVKNNRVNLRAKPGTAYTVLGQLNKDDEITIVGEDNDWFKIKPAKGLCGWVKVDYIRFFSLPEKDNIKKDKQTSPPTALFTPPSPLAQGILEDVGNIINRPAAYKLSSKTKLVYYLKPSANINFSGYINSEIKIWGQVSGMSDDGVPIVNVEKIELSK